MNFQSPKVTGICKRLRVLPNGVETRCGRCSDCRYSYQNDLVGRSLAESEFSDSVAVLTLTYNSDPENGFSPVLLDRRDIQLSFKRLRHLGVKQGFSFRYIGAGEYGEKKARAHWHVCLFFKGNAPSFEDGMSDVSWWPHGHIHSDPVTPRSLSYAVKYSQKDTSSGLKVSRSLRSTNPPLGHEFFDAMADRYLDDGLVPQTFIYVVPGVRNANGKHRKFLLKGKSREHFIDRFYQGFRARFPTRDFPPSELLDKYIDQRVADDPIYSYEKMESSMLRKVKEQYPFADLGQFRAKSVRFKLTDGLGLVIAKDNIGRWFLRSYDPDARLELERQLFSRADMRAALRDELKLFPLRR